MKEPTRHLIPHSDINFILFTFGKASTGHPIHPSVVDTQRIGKRTVLPKTAHLILKECEATDGALFDSPVTNKFLHLGIEEIPVLRLNSYIDGFIIVN